jgi:hypothetical protein
MRRFPCAALLVLAACGRSSRSSVDEEPTSPQLPARVDAGAAAADEPPEGTTTANGRCTKQAFATELSVPEASGSDWFEGANGPRILVIADSGNRGAWLEIDPGDGAVKAVGNLPLDGGASDDLEGLAISGGIAYAITSSGYLRSWKRGAERWEAVDAAYPIGPPGDKPQSLACANSRVVNCGKNYEGLCLADPPAADGCAGFAVAKTDGTLICLTRGADGRLAADPKRTIHLGEPGQLAGCEISPEGDRVWVGANLFGRNGVWAITDWRDPARAHVEHIGDFGPGFCESIAVGPGSIVYRFSDTGGAPSLVEKWGCR